MKDEPARLDLFLRFAGISLLAVGGATAALPEAHRQIVTQAHWLTSAQEFAPDFRHRPDLAGAQCHRVQPVRLAARRIRRPAGRHLGILGPSSLLAYGVARVMRRAGETAWLARLKKALTPLAIGLMAANGYLLARGADSGALAVVITLGAAAFVALSSRSPLWAMAVGAAVAVIAGRAGMI